MKHTKMLTAALAAFSLAGAANAATFTYQFHGASGNVATASPTSINGLAVNNPANVGAPTVTVTGWYTENNGGSFSSRDVRQNGTNGLGVGSHTVDNNGDLEYLLFYFGGASVDVNSFTIGFVDHTGWYVGSASNADYRWSVGNGPLTTLYSTGSNVNNDATGTFSVNGANALGTYFMIGVKPGDTNDGFKVSAINFNYTTPPSTQGAPDSGSTVALLGLGLLALAALKRRA
ncbi:MAG: VPDSG-CTERM sorting domain-containing protein [Opitutaceae bacterium]|nr:VPDSG-CTERM sorting domain-containing protein [Opitutaceae bacterium]